MRAAEMVVKAGLRYDLLKRSPLTAPRAGCPPGSPACRLAPRNVDKPHRSSSKGRVFERSWDAGLMCAAVGGGIGGGSVAGGGSSGGGGDSSGGGPPSNPGGSWDPRRIWTLLYGLAIIAGGVYAYVCKGSRPSLIASSAIGGLLLMATWQMGPYPQAGIGIAMVTTGFLALFMGNRFRRSRKFMPSGMLSITSLASASWYAGWPQL